MVFLVFGTKPRIPLLMVSLTALRYSPETTMMVMMVLNFATSLSLVSSTENSFSNLVFAITLNKFVWTTGTITLNIFHNYLQSNDKTYTKTQAGKD